MKFADRMKGVPSSFVREILKVTVDSEIISFAGGLPNPEFFPVDEFAEATSQVMSCDGCSALQYSTTEGYLPLREYIAERYLKKKGLNVHPNDILITNGSQQGLDLIGKVLLNPGDDVVIEKPGYLGAIQSLSVFQPQFRPVTLLDDGIDPGLLEETLKNNQVKLFYSVPNFQNPSGLTYSVEKRKKVADLMTKYGGILVEDDPYGELRYLGEHKPSIKSFMPENIFMLGSFSKIVAPGMRLGWVCASPEIMEQLVVAKQACDLHTNFFSQRILYQYLVNNDIDSHIQHICKGYKEQRDNMVEAIEKYFPQNIKTTRPEGGMFLWSELPEGMSSVELFKLSSARKVVFVPGNPFYADLVGDANTMRLNYTCCSGDVIRDGIQRLGEAMEEMIK